LPVFRLIPGKVWPYCERTAFLETTSAFGASERKWKSRVPTMRTGCAGGGEFARRIAPSLASAGLFSAAVLILSAASEAAQAQEPGGNEVPIGTFTLGQAREIAPSHDGFSIVEPPAGVPERKREGTDDGSGRWFFQGWDSPSAREASAEDLYKDAMTALEQGRRDDAQRLFERLVAESPNSPHVAAARQHLGRIYRSIEVGAQTAPPARAGSTGGETLPWAGAADPDAEAVAPGISQAVPRAVLHQARVSPVIDSEFLADAGDRVFFSAGSADLGARARGVILSQARFLLRYPELYAAVEGYADDGAASDAETLRLSEQRAAVVRERLIAEGVDAERLVAYGRGREDRVSDCPAPECLAQNRRAVTILLTRRIEAEAPARRRAQGAPSPQADSPMP
jgi:outer membrane protein OmpA-like peptidoglycan-associated protein